MLFTGTESGWRHPRRQVFLTSPFLLKSLAQRLARRNEKLTAWCDKLPHMYSRRPRRKKGGLKPTLREPVKGLTRRAGSEPTKGTSNEAHGTL